MPTEILADDCAAVRRAAEILKSGGTVAFPTETVYGLGADARRSSALRKIFNAKGRPQSNPLIVHVADIEAAERLAQFNPLARRAAQAFWPGPLTLLLPERPQAGIDRMAAAGQPVIGIRVPSHATARQLLAEFGHPVAAPSANISNRVSPTRTAHVLADLDGRIDAVIDGGVCERGLESTILMPSENGITLLRPGALTCSDIEGALDVRPAAPPNGDTPRAPGRNNLHYAPSVPLRAQARRRSADEVWIGFGPHNEHADFNLSPQGDLSEAAARLYGTLRQADELASRTGRSAIAVAPVPNAGIGAAINDRLLRAAGRLGRE